MAEFMDSPRAVDGTQFVVWPVSRSLKALDASANASFDAGVVSAAMSSGRDADGGAKIEGNPSNCDELIRGGTGGVVAGGTD